MQPLANKTMNPVITRRLGFVLAMFFTLASLPAASAEKHPASAKQAIKHTATSPTKTAKASVAPKPKPPKPHRVAAAKTPPKPRAAPVNTTAATANPTVEPDPRAANSVEPEAKPKPTEARRAKAKSTDAPVASEADYLAEMEAWKTYQTDTARAWKNYQARTISREAYDAEIKRARLTYDSSVPGNAGSGLVLDGKENALGNLKTWLQLEFCNTSQAQSSVRRHFGISGPTDGNGPVFAGLLNRFVLTVSPEASQRIENEVQEYRRASKDEIEARVYRIQANLNTRDTSKAYLGSWCDKQ